MLAYSNFLVAANAGTSSSSTDTLDMRSVGAIAINGAIQFHSLADEGKGLIGPAISYQLTTNEQLGLRTMVSMGSGGSYLFEAYLRHFLTEKTSRLFLEPSLAYNLVTQGTQSVGSAGLAIGFDHMLTSDISIGGAAGFEVFGTDLPLANYAKVGSIRFTPKVVVETSIHL